MRLTRLSLLLSVLGTPAAGLAAAEWPAWLPQTVRVGEATVRTGSGKRVEASRIEARRETDGFALSADSIVSKNAAGLAAHLPLRLDLRAPADGNAIVTGNLSDETGAFRIRLDLPRDGSALGIALEPLRFQPGQFEPATLLPALGGRIGDVTGEVQAQGSIPLNAPGDGTLTVGLSGISLDWSGLRFSGIASETRLSGIYPLRTPGPQAVRVERVNLGVLNGSGELTWFAEDGRLRVERAAFASEELTLAISKTRYDPDTGDGEGAIDVEHLDVDRLFQLLAVNGLTGSGKVAGSLPFALANAGAIEIENGSLKAEGPGVIRYAPESAPAALAGDNPGLVITRQALENFHYTSLGVTIDGRTDDQMQIGVQLAGSNPDLYGGHPIELNLNLDGALALLAQRVLDARALPDALSRRVLDLLD